MKVAIQGIAGSFHHEAAEKLLGNKISLLPCKTFQDVFVAVKNGDADQGVVAVENSLHGSINAVYRLLARNSVWVAGEVFLHINQYLIAPEKSEMKSIQKVLSQAPALAQCELWLESHLPDAHLEETHDTAQSVLDVLNQNDVSQSAIAGKHAAELYGGKILAGPINDDKHNYTRFFLLKNEGKPDTGANKTSIILVTGHEPGALYRAIGAFAEADVNLSKLDSHPIAGDKQHYAFYIDFEEGLNSRLEHKVFDQLRAQGCKVTILGSYRARNGV